ATDEEFAAEQDAEKRERNQIRYWSRPIGSDETDDEDMPGRSIDNGARPVHEDLHLQLPNLLQPHHPEANTSQTFVSPDLAFRKI
ncbi:hypothetical protein KI387_036551, partial [Taxus chinensis]